MPPVSKWLSAHSIGLLSVLVLLASAARVIGLDHLLVWHDEVFTLVRVLGHSQHEVQQAIFSAELLNAERLLDFQTPNPELGWSEAFKAFAGHPEHAPLYYVLGRLTTSLPLDPLVSLRGLSAIFGILLIPASYWLMRELFGRGLVPWVSASLIAFSPLQFLYAQEARQYALWTLLVVAASAALQRALRRDGITDWVVYGILVTLGLYSHLLFALLIPVHAVYGYLAANSNQGLFLPEAGRWAMATTAALIAFIPWLIVILSNLEGVERYTAWMTIPIGLDQIAASWGQHLARIFVDLNPETVNGLWVLALPLFWALVQFIRHAPRPGAWLLGLIALVYLSAVLAPDLILGGERSRHVRYALPGVLALQLMVAWVLAGAVRAEKRVTRFIGRGVLAAIIAVGGLSLVAIQASDTWWNKNFSAKNAEVARILNAGAHPLVVSSDIGLSSGELISLAHLLDDRVRIWGQRNGSEPVLPAGFDETIALTPSPELKALLEQEYELVPVAGTWQWFRAIPRGSAALLTPGAGSRDKSSARP